MSLPNDVRIALLMAVCGLRTRTWSKKQKALASQDAGEWILWAAEAENDKRAVDLLCNHFGIRPEDLDNVPFLAFVGSTPEPDPQGLH